MAQIKANINSPFASSTRSMPSGGEAEQKAFGTGDKTSVSVDVRAVVTYTFDGAKWTPDEGKHLK